MAVKMIAQLEYFRCLLSDTETVLVHLFVAKVIFAPFFPLIFKWVWISFLVCTVSLWFGDYKAGVPSMSITEAKLVDRIPLLQILEIVKLHTHNRLLENVVQLVVKQHNIMLDSGNTQYY